MIDQIKVGQVLVGVLIALMLGVAALLYVSLTSEPDSARAATGSVSEAAPNVGAAVTASREILRREPQSTLRGLASPGALEFPAGTSYAEALRQLYMAQQTGKAPEGARLVAGLPRGVALLQQGDGSGLVLDLATPLGYLPFAGDRVQPFLLHYGEGATEAEIEAARAGLGRADAPWPKGAYVAVPTLPDCMRVTSRSALAPTCGANSAPTFAGFAPGQVPLP